MAEDLTDLIAEANRLEARYGLDSYSLSSSIERICDHDQKKTSRLMWAAFRAGELNIANHHLWNELDNDVSAYNGDDFMAWIEALEKLYPNGEEERDGYKSQRTDYNSLEGHIWKMDALIAKKVEAEDAAFAKTLAARWTEAPKPWRIALNWHLARRGIIPVSALEAETLSSAAQKQIAHGGSDWVDPMPIEPGPWAEHLLSALKANLDLVIGEPAQLTPNLVSHLPPTALIEFILRFKLEYSSWTAITAMDVLPDEARPLFAQAFADLTIKPIEYDTAWPAFFLLFGYLRACGRANATPDPIIDANLVKFFEHYTQGWSGGDEHEFRDRLRKELARVPTERLEKALLKPKKLQLELALASNTPEMLQHITDVIAGFPARGDYEFDQQIERLSGVSRYGGSRTRGEFTSMAQQLVPYFTEALKAGTPGQRMILVWTLVDAADPSTAEGLTVALADKSKGIREIALPALVKLGAEVALPHVIPLLSARRKDTRLSAAQVLVGLPPTAEAYDAAQAQIAKEKVADVIALLSQVKPAGDAVQGDAALDSAIAESEGAVWAEHIDAGAALVEAFWKLLASKFNESYMHESGEIFDRWIAMLTALKDLPAAQERALDLIPAYDQYDGKSYLNTLRSKVYGEAFVPMLTRWIKTASFKRPVEFGAYHSVWDLKQTIGWAAGDDDTPPALPILIFGLGDRRKTVRREARDPLKSMGTKALAALHEALASGPEAARPEVAELLGELSDPSSAEVLATAREGASGALADRLDEALAAIQAASLNLDDFPITDAGLYKLNIQLGKLPRAPVPSGVTAKDLPRLQWVTGREVSGPAQRWIVGALGQETLEKHTTLLGGLRDRLDEGSRKLFVEAFVETSYGRFEGWRLFAQALLGAPSHIDAIAGQLETLASSQRTHWGDDGVESLARAGTDAAIRHLDKANRKGRRDALRWRAGAALGRLAARRNMTAEALVDSAMSDCGFDLQGEQRLNYGPREITLRLTDELQIQIIDEAGKVKKSMPAARAADDANLVTRAKAHLSAIKKEMRDIGKVQPRRLENAQAGERTWGVAEWQKRFEHHALMRVFAKRLVWEAMKPGQDEASAGVPFIIAEPEEAHALVSVTGDGVTLPEGGGVRLLHPAHMMEETDRNAWKDALDHRSRRALFHQLDRPVITVNKVPEDDRTLFTSLPQLTAGLFMKGLSDRGYERGPREDAGMISVSYRTLGEYSVTLSHGGYSPDWFEGEVELYGVSVSKDGESLDWRALPTVVFSEIALDVYRISGAIIPA